MVVATLVASAMLALPGAQMGTTLRIFSPWAGSMPALGVKIDRTLKGSCTTVPSS